MSQKIQNQYKALAAPFPKGVESILKKGGQSLTYIPIHEVIARLNSVLGVENWSHQIISIGRDSLNPDQVIAQVRLTVTFWNEDGSSYTVVRDGVGGQKVKMMKDDKGPVDLGDEFKGAASDALKKAAQAFGVTLYLARDEEAIAIEAREELANMPVPEAWTRFTGVVKTLSPEARDKLNKFWVKHAGERPKPTMHDFNEEDLEELHREAVRLAMDGEYVES